MAPESNMGGGEGNEVPLVVEAEAPLAKDNTVLMECHLKATQPISQFSSLSDFLAAQVAYCYNAVRVKQKILYSVKCNRCSKQFKWVPPLIAHTLLPEKCNVFHFLQFQNQNKITCQFCSEELSVESFEFHQYSRHLSLMLDLTEGDTQLREYLEQSLEKYVVIACDRCTFSLRMKGNCKVMADIFFRHWKICKEVDDMSAVSLLKRSLHCPKCGEKKDFRAFTKHTSCGEAATYEQVVQFEQIQAPETADVNRKRPSVARGINFRDIYGAENDHKDNWLDLNLDPSTSLAAAEIVEDLCDSGNKVKTANELGDSLCMNGQNISHTGKTLPGSGGMPSSTTRRHFSWEEIDEQKKNQQYLFKLISEWNPPLFPNLKPIQHTLPVDGQTDFAAETPAEFDSILFENETYPRPNQLHSVALGKQGFNHVLNVGGGTPVVSCAITSQEYTHFILCSTKLSKSTRYPASIRNEEPHIIQLWKYGSGADCIRLETRISVTGLFWRLKWLDLRRVHETPGVQCFVAASSAGCVTMTPLNLCDSFQRHEVVTYRSVRLLPKTDLGQCLSVDFQYTSEWVSRVIAGFSNGCVAIWVLQNSSVSFESDSSAEVYADLVIVAHLSGVSSAVWDLFNADYFATCCPMVEDSFKVWSLTNFMDGPIVQSTVMQVIGVESDPYMSAFHYVISHCNFLKSTLPASILVTEEELFCTSVKITHHEKLEKQATTGFDFPLRGNCMFLCTEEGYLFRSESRVQIVGKKAKVTSCPVVMSTSFNAENRSLTFTDRRVTVADSTKFPDEASMMTCVAAHPLNMGKQYLTCVGFKSGIVRLKLIDVAP